MGLYFVFTPNIKNRRADLIFFFEGGNCCLSHRDRVPQILFSVDNVNVDTYRQIVGIVEKNQYDSYEISLTGKEHLEELLEFFNDYLVDKDISIGLLTTDADWADDNRSLIESYGVTSPNIYIARGFNPSFIEREESHILLKNAIRKPSSDEACVSGAIRKEKPKVNRKPTTKIVLDEPFHDKFIKLLIESGKDNVDIYKKAGVSRQVFSKIISDKNMIPSKLTLISLCIGLELPLKQAKAIMESAGYAFSKSKALDVIVMKYLSEEIYDFDLINSELNEYGCALLGWHPRDD